MKLSLLNKTPPEGNVPKFEREDDFMAERRKRMSYSLFTSARPKHLYYSPQRQYRKRGR